MSETQQTHAADASQSGEAGNVNAKVEAPSVPVPTADANPQAAELKALNTVMGREFKNLDEAREHYQNLNKLVGDNAIAEQRKAAQAYDALVLQIAKENGWSRAASIAYLEDLQTSSNSTEKQASSFDAKSFDENDRLQKLERELFLAKTPEAAKYLDKVEKYAKTTRTSLSEAYAELYGDVIQTAKEEALSEALRQEKLGAQVSASSSTPAAPEINRYAELMEKYRKTGNSEFFREATKEKWNKNPGLRKATE